MLNFCAEKGISCDVEMIDIQDINTAYDRMLKSDVTIPLRHRPRLSKNWLIAWRASPHKDSLSRNHFYRSHQRQDIAKPNKPTRFKQRGLLSLLHSSVSPRLCG